MRPRKLFAALLLAVNLAIGFGVAWATAVAWIGSWFEPEPAPAKSVVFRPNGDVVLKSYTMGTRAEQFEDLRGAPVEIRDDEQFLSEIALASDERWPERAYWNAAGSGWGRRVRGFSDSRKQSTNWYVIWDGRADGRAYLAGYDEASKRQIGFIGREGFRSNLPDTLPFAFGRSPLAISDQVVSPQPWNGSLIPVTGLRGKPTVYADFEGWDAAKLYLRTLDHRLYAADLNERSVHAVLEDRSIVACALAPLRQRRVLQGRADAAVAGPVLVVRTQRDVLLLDNALRILRRYTLPRELLTKAITWSEIAPGKAIGSWTETIYDPYRRVVQHVAWFDAGGTVSRREPIAFPSDGGADTAFIALAVPSLAMDLLAVALLCPTQMLNDVPTTTWAEALRLAIAAYWSTIVLTFVISVALAACCYRRQARFAASPREQIIWTLFVFIGGLPGWIGYRYCRRWAVLEPCSQCGATIPRDSHRCVRCRREIPRPAALGTEVFA